VNPTQSADKSLATVRAQLALLGHRLEVCLMGEDKKPTYWVSRWTQSRSFGSMEEVKAFQIGGSHGL
jgi:hypothetical protein